MPVALAAQCERTGTGTGAVEHEPHTQHQGPRERRHRADATYILRRGSEDPRPAGLVRASGSETSAMGPQLAHRVGTLRAKEVQRRDPKHL